jgi:hypothetical protein
MSEENEWGGSIGRMRRREEGLDAHDALDPRGKRQRVEESNQLILISGEIIDLTDTDGKNILVNETLEPNIFVRKCLSKIPKKIKDRFMFLSKFSSEALEDPYIEDFQDKLYTAFIRELRMRTIFKKLWALWRVYKMNSTYEKDVDPITLNPPEKEVILYDWRFRMKFIFDARSLANHIESKLYYQESGFAIPQHPRNPANNVQFTYTQILRIYEQLKAHGELLWGLTTMRESNFSMKKWYMYNKPTLTMRAIKYCLVSLDTPESRELLLSFILTKMEELEYYFSTHTILFLQKAIVYAPQHWYLEECKSIAIESYEAEQFDLDKHDIINERCKTLFRKQRKFMKELIRSRII